MATISSLGIGSGIDFESMVTGLLDAEFQAPTVQLETEQEELNTELSAVGVMKSAMQDFKDVVETLSDTSTFEKRTGTSADTTKFTISATDGAPIGVFGIEVTQLAQAHKLTLDVASAETTTTIGSGRLTFSIGSSSFNIDIAAGTDTMQDIVNAVNNSEDNIGVSASIIDTDAGATLVFTSNNSGVDNAMQIAVTDDDGNHTDTSGLSQLVYEGTTSNMTETDAALNATMNIDGKAVSSASNTFTTALTGVTITAIAIETSSGTETNATISQDTTAIATHIDDFIDKYNAIVTVMDTYANYDSDSESSGPLHGDSTTRTFYSLFTKQATEKVSGLTGNYQYLASLGISRDRNGMLEINQAATLSTAMTSNMASVKQLFTDTSDGIATRMEELMDSYLDSDGVYTQKELAISEEIRQNLIDFEELEADYVAQEETLRARFSYLDASLAQLDSISQMVESSVDSLKSTYGSND